MIKAELSPVSVTHDGHGRWVARALRRVLILQMLRRAAMVVSCCALLVACGVVDRDDEPRHRYTDLLRFGYVLTNAFRATHPEFMVISGDIPWSRAPDEMAIELWADQNFDHQTRSGPYPPLAFAIRQDRDSGRIHYTTPHDRVPVPLRDLLGSLGVESSALSSAIRRIGRPDAAKKAIDEELKEVGRSKEVTAVVELEVPLTMSDIRKRKHLSDGNAIFSPATADGPPIYWDSRITEFCRSCGGSSDGMTDDFRFWVHLLEPVDEAVLDEFGLSLARLREVARAGKVHGFIAYDANPVLLRKLLKQDYVRTMHFVRTRQHCDPDLDGCVPGSWPKDDELYG
ncbi:hypothetical protein [Nonomuraea glycinis]|uniref:hypothetical protein n=1 Tax=Nonomuraea glycinis TaxID=2047744 RepID=UPI0033B65D5D